MIGTVDFERNGMIATITLNRPAKLNAVSLEMAQELEKIVGECNENPDSASKGSWAVALKGF